MDDIIPIFTDNLTTANKTTAEIKQTYISQNK